MARRGYKKLLKSPFHPYILIQKFDLCYNEGFTPQKNCRGLVDALTMSSSATVLNRPGLGLKGDTINET